MPVPAGSGCSRKRWEEHFGAAVVPQRLCFPDPTCPSQPYSCRFFCLPPWCLDEVQACRCAWKNKYVGGIKTTQRREHWEL